MHSIILSSLYVTLYSGISNGSQDSLMTFLVSGRLVYDTLWGNRRGPAPNNEVSMPELRLSSRSSVNGEFTLSGTAPQGCYRLYASSTEVRIDVGQAGRIQLGDVPVRAKPAVWNGSLPVLRSVSVSPRTPGSISTGQSRQHTSGDRCATQTDTPCGINFSWRHALGFCRSHTSSLSSALGLWSSP